jgi:hypothetical protein
MIFSSVTRTGIPFKPEADASANLTTPITGMAAPATF